MKAFAFLLASLFIVQVVTPAICMTDCLFEPASSCCVLEATEEESCCIPEEEITICSMQEKASCCAAEEITSCTIAEANGIAERTESDIPCNDCGVPCCSVPLCCCFYQEVAEINFSTNVAALTAQLPSNNGIPVSGYLDECFQPPEVI